MITRNFEDYPEHRLKFFSLLRAIATHCFPALIRLSSEVGAIGFVFSLALKVETRNCIFYWFLSWFFSILCVLSLLVTFYKLLQELKLVMDSIIWAFRHTERNIAETGLNLLLEMLKNFEVCVLSSNFWCISNSLLHGRYLFWYFSLQVSEFSNQFYRTYFLIIEQEIFAVLTDTFHKPGFKLHVLVLQHLFCLVMSTSWYSSKFSQLVITELVTISGGIWFIDRAIMGCSNSSLPEL